MDEGTGETVKYIYTQVWCNIKRDNQHLST